MASHTWNHRRGSDCRIQGSNACLAASAATVRGMPDAGCVYADPAQALLRHPPNRNRLSRRQGRHQSLQDLKAGQQFAAWPPV